MSGGPIAVGLVYNDDLSGTISIPAEDLGSPAWARLKLSIRSRGVDHTVSGSKINLSWIDLLGVVRELGSKSTQQSLNFRFRPEGVAKDKLRLFVKEIIGAREHRAGLTATLGVQEIQQRLRAAGFVRRELKQFQIRDLSRLLALSNGANFSVPGSGKTTVTFALHILTRLPGHHFMVVAPRSAFQAWVDVVGECMLPGSPDSGAERFLVLSETEEINRRALESGARRFIISYDMVIRQQGLIESHFATNPTHLVLDESHRVKAGWGSQRGAFFLRISDIPVRRDILTGTPMPQASSDMEPQLEFLWPGHGYGFEVSKGKPPREVLGSLYVRTTKQELGLPDPKRRYVDVSMDPAQLALYSMVRNEFVRNYSQMGRHGVGHYQILRARRSVMRLLQLSVNPVLAVGAMSRDHHITDSAIFDAVMEQGHSAKMRAVMEKARELAESGKKAVIWTIFTDTIHSLASALADLNPVYVHGGIPSGTTGDVDSREGRIRRFHEDRDCFVLIANPAAAGEGISLHTVCHDAIYVDRSYVSTHYLQSIDRVHRLGLSLDQETHIYIYRSKAPTEVGSIDLSVSRRLKEKIRNMQLLLNDPDLHELALDEEQAAEPFDYGLELLDITDLIAELEGRHATVAFDET